nr:hypothetical protein CFP56_78860 [Quercus suber]POE85196.1 hypothetical protein CFP56_67354 [Quercus suber]
MAQRAVKNEIKIKVAIHLHHPQKCCGATMRSQKSGTSHVSSSLQGRVDVILESQGDSSTSLLNPVLDPTEIRLNAALIENPQPQQRKGRRKAKTTQKFVWEVDLVRK